jgi:UDP-glucose 4-epimerase
MSKKGSTRVAVVTGCAGFIGSNLTDRLLEKGYKVIGIDNFTTGRREFLRTALLNVNFDLHELDLYETVNLSKLFDGSEIVFHLAANADVRFGAERPRRDLEQNTIVTHNVLEAMRISGVKRIVFSSTGSIYGESQMSPTPEDAPFPIQTSLYGASKLACEGLIQAYCETFDMQSWIFRFVSILGPRYSHGHVFDFYKQLRDDQNILTVLGNGHQRKSYLHVADCIDAIQIALQSSNRKVNIFNLGVNDTCEVRDSVKWICEHLEIEPRVDFGIESRGWVGDNPLIHLATSQINSLGWEPAYSIKQGIESTIDYLRENEWLLDSELDVPLK